MDKILEQIQEIERAVGDDTGFIQLFSDGSGTYINDDDEGLFYWDNLEEFFEKAEEYLNKEI